MCEHLPHLSFHWCINPVSSFWQFPSPPLQVSNTGCRFTIREEISFYCRWSYFVIWAMTTHSDPGSWGDLVIVPLLILNESLWGARGKKRVIWVFACVCGETTEERDGWGDYLGRCRWKWDRSHLPAFIHSVLFRWKEGETDRQGEHKWKAWKRELLKRQHFVTTSGGYTAVSKGCC